VAACDSLGERAERVVVLLLHQSAGADLGAVDACEFTSQTRSTQPTPSHPNHSILSTD